MSQSSQNGQYIVISPVKDEERHVETTIRAVMNQTLRPALWVIVDDGSQDKTPEIVGRYANHLQWIRVLRLDRDTQRNLGWAEIRAFAVGYELLAGEEFDFVVKLDGDVDLPPDYFAHLIAEFHKDEKLGIASGECMERRRSGWYPSSGPPYHAVGASKMVRAQCFKDIGGFALHPGWDTVDEIRAQMRGWRTRHFDKIKFYHLRTEGSAIGSVGTGILHGEVYYWTGGGPLFLLLKFLHRSFTAKPFLLGGLAMLWGYLRLLAAREARLVSDSEARFYRQLLNRRIRQSLGRLQPRNRPRDAARSVS